MVPHNSENYTIRSSRRVQRTHKSLAQAPSPSCGSNLIPTQTAKTRTQHVNTMQKNQILNLNLRLLHTSSRILLTLTLTTRQFEALPANTIPSPCQCHQRHRINAANSVRHADTKLKLKLKLSCHHNLVIAQKHHMLFRFHPQESRTASLSVDLRFSFHDPSSLSAWFVLNSST